MRLLAILPGLLAIWSAPGCFDVKYANCRILCTEVQGCPVNLNCVINEGSQGLCAPEGMSCPSVATDGDGVVADAGIDADIGVDGASDATGGPPDMLCRKDCFPLTNEVRASLVLLLWPSSLPSIGSQVSIWSDLSGQGNDAHAVNPSALPTVISSGVRLASESLGGGFVVANSPSVDFGAGDFVIFVVAGVETVAPSSFFVKADGARFNPRRIALEWGYSDLDGTTRPQVLVNDTTITAGSDIDLPSVNLYTVRRTGGHVELRVNGAVWGSGDLASAQASTSNAENVFIGVPSAYSNSVNTLQAILAVRGALSSTDVDGLETFLRGAFLDAP